MKSIFKKLFCIHEWHVIAAQKTIVGMGWKATTYIVACDKCGKIKKITIIDEKQ